MAFEAEIEELERRRAKARAMGSARRLQQFADDGLLKVRQRLDHLLDDRSFVESGLLALPARAEDHDRAPADGSVDGFGKIGGRPVLVNAADFSAMGSSSAEINDIKKQKM